MPDLLALRFPPIFPNLPPMPFVMPHDPNWADRFLAEAADLRAALPITLHHIGSTSIPGILAKPIIDLLGEVAALALADDATPKIEALGYEAMGAFGLPGRRYFRKVTQKGIRTHHLHIYQTGNPELTRHLAFRDYLRAHPDVAADYSDLKAKLVAMDGFTAEHYMDGKDPFIKRIEVEALQWTAKQPHHP